MMGIYIITMGILLALDQWTKWLTVHTLSLGEVKEVWPPFFSVTYLQNKGAAWSILQGKLVFFTIVTILACIVILYFFFKYSKKSKWFSFSLIFILAGALGNFIDRITQGFVVDMIQLDFIDFPIFNIADMCLVCGVFSMAIFILKVDDHFFKEK